MANERPGPLVRKIVRDLSADGGTDYESLLAAVDYSPGRQSHLALVLKAELTVTDQMRVGDGVSYVDSATPSGRFLNLRFNDKLASLYAERELRTGRAMVEHSSLVPVYPLNLATFRSSIVGEWIRRSLLYLGKDAQSRFWVQESARQVRLLLAAARSASRRTSGGNIGKSDHTIGRIFAEAVLREGGLNGREARSLTKRMFPLGEPGVHRPLRGDWVHDVLLGWRATFSASGVHVDHFDRERDILNGLDWRSYLEHAREFDGDSERPRGPLDVHQLRYIEWSVLYYIFLLLQCEHATSVVNYRQAEKQMRARSIACRVLGRPETSLRVIAFGDVAVDDTLDRIRTGNFHSVDDLSQYAGRDVSCLVERFLTARSISNLHLSLPITSIETYPGVSRMGNVSPLPHAVLLLDELPLLLESSACSGDFTRVVRWTGRASAVQTKLDSSVPPDLDRDFTTAINLFSPFPTRLG